MRGGTREVVLLYLKLYGSQLHVTSLMLFVFSLWLVIVGVCSYNLGQYSHYAIYRVSYSSSLPMDSCSPAVAGACLCRRKLQTSRRGFHPPTFLIADGFSCVGSRLRGSLPNKTAGPGRHVWPPRNTAAMSGWIAAQPGRTAAHGRVGAAEESSHQWRLGGGHGARPPMGGWTAGRRVSRPRI